MYEERFSKDYYHHHNEGNYKRVRNDNKKFDLMNILKRTVKYIYIKRMALCDGSSKCPLTPLIPINLSRVPEG
jgi:hypothetical protein